MSRRRTTLTIALSLFLSIYLFYTQNTTPRARQTPHALPPANSTLSFGAIIAVSHARSPRRPGLLWAANLTDLDIGIPEQPEWTVGEVEEFKAKEGSSISSGSAKAWLGHLHALKDFLQNAEHETALVLEDDTDFDISIRTTQIPLLAAAVRSLFNSSSSSSYSPSEYWAPTAHWDILYPGHCDNLLSPSAYLGQPHIAYHNPSAPSPQQLHSDTALFLYSLNIPSKTRFLHRAYWPFCTFAYAVNRRSAEIIVGEMDKEPDDGVSAYDVALLTACRDRGWKCWSVAPEFFRHSQGVSEIAVADLQDFNIEGGRSSGGMERSVSLRGT
jgi:hypothetical protein